MRSDRFQISELIRKSVPNVFSGYMVNFLVGSDPIVAALSAAGIEIVAKDLYGKGHEKLTQGARSRAKSALRSILEEQFKNEYVQNVDGVNRQKKMALTRIYKSSFQDDKSPKHPAFSLLNGHIEPKIREDALDGSEIEATWLEPLMRAERDLTVWCTPVWPSFIAAFRLLNEILQAMGSENQIIIDYTSPVGNLQTLRLCGATCLPDIIVNADAVMHPGWSPVTRNYKLAMPIIYDTVRTLRRRPNINFPIPLENVVFCAETGAHEAAMFGDIPNKEEKSGLPVEEIRQKIKSSLREEEGILIAPNVAYYYGKEKDFVIDRKRHSDYYVSLYVKDDLGWKNEYVSQFLNAFFASWHFCRRNLGSTTTNLIQDKSFFSAFRYSCEGFRDSVDELETRRNIQDTLRKK